MTFFAVVLMLAALGVVAFGANGILRSLSDDRAGRRSMESVESGRELSEIAYRRTRTLHMIQQVNLDLQTGRISDETAKERTKKLEVQAARLGRSLDRLRGDEAALASASGELDDVLGAVISDDSDWQWSEAAIARHGGAAPEMRRGDV